MSTRPPLGCSVPGMVERYLGTEYDKVKLVADNIEYVQEVAEGIAGLPVKSYAGPTPPTRPVMGAEWYCTTDGRTYIWYVDEDSSQWVESSPQNAGLHISAYTGNTPPTKPEAGTTWYCTSDGRNYIWYVNADSSQWVESSPQSVAFEPTNKMVLNAAATDAATTTALVNQIRAGLIANGLAL